VHCTCTHAPYYSYRCRRSHLLVGAILCADTREISDGGGGGMSTALRSQLCYSLSCSLATLYPFFIYPLFIVIVRSGSRTPNPLCKNCRVRSTRLNLVSCLPLRWCYSFTPFMIGTPTVESAPSRPTCTITSAGPAATSKSPSAKLQLRNTSKLRLIDWRSQPKWMRALRNR